MPLSETYPRRYPNRPVSETQELPSGVTALAVALVVVPIVVLLVLAIPLV